MTNMHRVTFSLWSIKCLIWVFVGSICFDLMHNNTNLICSLVPLIKKREVCAYISDLNDLLLGCYYHLLFYLGQPLGWWRTESVAKITACFWTTFSCWISTWSLISIRIHSKYWSYMGRQTFILIYQEFNRIICGFYLFLCWLPFLKDFTYTWITFIEVETRLGGWSLWL